MKTLTTALLAALPFLCSIAADLPPLVFPQGVGVNIHFTRGHERDLDMIRDAGFKFVRMDFGWSGIERKKGVYDWSAYDELTANLEKRGLRPLYILDYSNALYEETTTSVNPLTGKQQRDTASPSKPESVAAFAKWAGEAAAHYKGRGVVWEIWNEPNISFWKPKPNVKDYITLAVATCKAVREADPNATIIAPASSGFPWPFFEEMFKAGLLEHLDAVSVHPYRSYSQGPETAAADYLRLRTLIERYAPADKKSMPIISGEWGYASHSKGVSLETQAAFIARQQIANLAQGVPISIWYDWKNDGLEPDYNEHHFGTVSNALAPKPAYLAMQTLTRELGGYSIARRIETTNRDDFVFLLVDTNGQQKVAAWTAGKGSDTLSLPLGDITAEQVRIVNGQSQPVSTTMRDGALILRLEPAPQYITLRKKVAMLQAAAAWRVSGFLPTLTHAGADTTHAVPVEITNPFATPVTVRLAVDSTMMGTKGAVAQLAPSESKVITMTLKPRLRAAAPTSYKITAEYSRGFTVIGTSSETRQLLVSNPLHVSVAPAQALVRVQVENPAGVAFTGRATINGAAVPLRFAEGQTNQVLRWTGPTAGVASVALQDQDGRPVTEPISMRFLPVTTTNLKGALDGDAKVPATTTLSQVDAPGENPPYRQAHRLQYRFDEGWRFVRAHPTGKSSQTFEGNPTALGMWVYGDNSGNALRMRVIDATGQTFQPNGPDLDWSGWRWVQFDLQDMAKAGHWGGANDGIPHFPLKLDTLLLVDGARKKTEGMIYFAGPEAVYEETPIQTQHQSMRLQRKGLPW